MMLIEASGEVHIEAARAREVFDVSGAGDTVIAVLALTHASGQKLPEAMRLANTAAGIVVHGTSARQRVITATLGTLAEAASGANLESPALLIVGDVVALHSTLAWFGAASSESEAAADLSQTA